MEIKEVNYYVRYIGKSDSAIKNGKTYECIAEYYRNGELFSLSVIDDTEEDYQYSPKVFEKVAESVCNPALIIKQILTEEYCNKTISHFYFELQST